MPKIAERPKPVKALKLPAGDLLVPVAVIAERPKPVKALKRSERTPADRLYQRHSRETKACEGTETHRVVPQIISDLIWIAERPKPVKALKLLFSRRRNRL